MRDRAKAWSAIAALIVMGAAGAAHAADEEIQVYQDDMSKKGQYGLDVHVNYVAENSAPLDYRGQQPSVYRTRITPEFAYGLTEHVELGLYLPLTTIEGNRVSALGEKVRIKYIATKPDAEGLFWGANFEIGRVDKPLDINPWNAELKGIAGWRKDRWTVGFNTNIDWAVSGPDRGPASVQFATKVSYKINENLAFGVESYNGAGDFNHFGQFSGAGHAIYAVTNASLGKWDMEFGVGHGYSGENDAWTLKMIVGVPIDD
jgi:hypothetical protein